MDEVMHQIERVVFFLSAGGFVVGFLAGRLSCFFWPVEPDKKGSRHDPR